MKDYWIKTSNSHELNLPLWIREETWTSLISQWFVRPWKDEKLHCLQKRSHKRLRDENAPDVFSFLKWQMKKRSFICDLMFQVCVCGRSSCTASNPFKASRTMKWLARSRMVNAYPSPISVPLPCTTSCLNAGPTSRPRDRPFRISRLDSGTLLYMLCKPSFILADPYLSTRYRETLASFRGVATFGIYLRPQLFDVTFQQQLIRT